MTAIQAIYGRRAVRSFVSMAVDRDSVRALLDAAIQAPSAMNAQPWGFVVVQDTAKLARLSDQAKALLAKRSDPKSVRYAALFENPAFNIFYDASTLIVICGPAEGQYVQADCWLAAENLMIAAHALGLGTCCIGFAQLVLDQPDVRIELGIPSDMRAYAPIIVGLPHGTVPPVPRNPVRILSWS
jgi:nitroreductase